MKLAIASDLHIEFGPVELKNTEGADALILAGDILVVADLRVWHKAFFEECLEEFKNVFYVFGNHEFYHHDLIRAKPMVAEITKAMKGFHILDNNSVELDGKTFFGGTMWTNMNNDDPMAKLAVSRGMNDFRIVTKASDRFTPDHAMEEWNMTVSKLEETVSATNNDVVVITHHAPSPSSIHEKYKNDTLMNGNFHSNMDEFILNNPQIQLWIHGHTHDPFDYGIGGTRVFCNPRGYIQYEQRAQEFKLEIIELL